VSEASENGSQKDYILEKQNDNLFK